MPRPVLNLSAVLAAVTVVALASPTAAAPVPSCFGQRATVVADDEGATVTGTPGRDVVVVTADGVTVETGGGADLVCDRRASAQISTGVGADRVRGGASVDTGDGADRVEVDPDASAGVDTGAGDDVVTGLDGGDAAATSIGTGDGADVVRAGLVLSLVTGAGSDRVDQRGGGSTLLGDGDDQLLSRDGGFADGGAGRDVLTGTAASTATFFDTAGDDVFRSASRRNLVSYAYSAPVVIDLRRQRSVVGTEVNTFEGVRDVAGSLGDDVIVGDDDPNRIVDVVVGQDDIDPVPGSTGRDVVDARGGDDRVSVLGTGSTVRGGAGDDEIGVNGTASGGAGDDTLSGSDADDDLVGGAGTDSADGAVGTDRCVAETEVACER